LFFVRIYQQNQENIFQQLKVFLPQEFFWDLRVQIFLLFSPHEKELLVLEAPEEVFFRQEFDSQESQKAFLVLKKYFLMPKDYFYVA
jgi:hypothetical protein